jgi:RNA polymerase sigma factor (sigma-70 family)
MASNSFEEMYNGSVDKNWIDFYLGDMKARERIIVSNLDLINLCINSLGINFSYEEKENLFSIGEITLINAVDRFDIGKGYTFSKYGFVCIKNSLCDYLRKKQRRDLYNYEFESFDDETDFFSLSVIDTLDIEDVYDDKVLANDIYEAYSLLKDKYKEVIKLYFGMFDGKQYTVKEIADILNKSPNQVRWLVEKGVLNIRKILECFGYDNETMAKTYQNRLKLPKK